MSTLQTTNFIPNKILTQNNGILKDYFSLKTNTITTVLKIIAIVPENHIWDSLMGFFHISKPSSFQIFQMSNSQKWTFKQKKWFSVHKIIVNIR